MKTIHNDWLCTKYADTVLPDENNNCSLCGATIVPLDKSIEYVTSEDEARQQAIDWQDWQAEQSLSYGELLEWVLHFQDIAKKFNLTEEFEENGIL